MEDWQTMYTVGNIIYGIPLTQEILNVVGEVEDAEDVGFETTYSGAGGTTPGWCGVVLDTIDECSVADFSLLKLTPTPEQIDAVNQKVAALSEEILKVSSPIGCYIVWSTS